MMTYNERTRQYDTTCESCGETAPYRLKSAAKLYETRCLQCQRYPLITKNDQGQWIHPCPNCARTKSFGTRALALISFRKTAFCYTCVAKVRAAVKAQQTIKRYKKAGIRVQENMFRISCAECNTSLKFNFVKSAKYHIENKLLCPKCQRKKASVNYTDSTERWKPIPGFDYEVSDQGRVRNSINWRLLIANHAGIDRAYRTVTLFKDRKYNQKYIHHLVINAFGDRRRRPDDSDGVPFVRHRDGDTANNVISNLYWTTTLGPRGQREGSVSYKILEALKTGPKSATQLQMIAGSDAKGVSSRLFDLTLDKLVKRHEQKQPCPITNKRCYHYTLN